jgi:hypothetical protein
MFTNFLQCTNPALHGKERSLPFRATAFTSILCGFILLLSACGTKKKQLPDIQSDSPVSEDVVAKKQIVVPEVVVQLRTWFDTSIVRSQKPDILSDVSNDDYESLLLEFRDSLNVRFIGMSDSTESSYALAFEVDDSERFPEGRAYLIVKLHDERIAELETFTIPEPFDQLAILQDAYEHMQAISGAKTGTSMRIGGKDYAKMNPVQYPVIDEVRRSLAEFFSPGGVDATMKNLHIVEKNGNLWLPKSGAYASLNWDEADVYSTTVDDHGFISEIVFPEDDPPTNFLMHFRLTVHGWRLDDTIKTP